MTRTRICVGRWLAWWVAVRVYALADRIAGSDTLAHLLEEPPA